MKNPYRRERQNRNGIPAAIPIYITGPGSTMGTCEYCTIYGEAGDEWWQLPEVGLQVEKRNISACRHEYLRRLHQSVMNAAAWLTYSSSSFDHIVPVLFNFRGWRQRIGLVTKISQFTCMRKCICSPYLPDELCRPTDSQARCRLARQR